MLGPKIRSSDMKILKRFSARQMLIINQGGTTNNFNGNNNIPPTLEPRAISLKNIPEPHTSFTGRVEYVKLVIEYLIRPVVAEVQIQFPWLIIHALGGYGKTQTARKIASVCRKERKFQHFIWIDSEDYESVKKSFVAVMIQVGLNASVKTDALNFDLLLHQFYNLLASQNHEKFLIIFDNVEDFENILTFLPLNRSASNLAVLMTSQRSFTRESYGHIRNQSLDLMLEQEAIQLVENILGTSTMESPEDKKLLVKRSGRIALVLCVMTSTIKFQRRYEPEYKIKDYLDEMGDKPIQYSDKSNNLDLNYDKCLQKIVRFAVDKLNGGVPIERIAVNIFDRMVYLSSTNHLREYFVRYFRDICDDAINVDMELPIKPVDHTQVIRMAIEKLSEFSLAQIVDNEHTVHRWIQASRRLDLKASGNGKAVLKKLLFMGKTIIIWEHVVADYPALVIEFYAKRKTLLEFPIANINILEKVIPILTQSADFQPISSTVFAKEIEEVIDHYLSLKNFDGVKRAVDLFNYDTKKLMSKAISLTDVDVVKWLLDEKSFIPNEDHLRQCVSTWGIEELTLNLASLRELRGEITEQSSSESEFESDRSRFLRQRLISERIESFTEGILLFSLKDSDPKKIHLCKIIEKNCGEDLLQHMLSYASDHLRAYEDFGCNSVFEIMRIILSALKKFEAHIELDEIIEKYSEPNLLECFFFCGLTHFTVSHSEWRDLQRVAIENSSPAIKQNDTSLLTAVKNGAHEALTVLLEKRSENVNAIDGRGETALSYAIKLCYPSICKILLRHGARTHWKTQSGASVHALHMAVETFINLDGPDTNVIIYAIATSNNCDVCAVDDLGNNILHLLVGNYYATRYKPNNNVLQFVLSACPTLVDMRNNGGVTPLQLAISLRDKFWDNHWHRASLQSFISTVEPIAAPVPTDA